MTIQSTHKNANSSSTEQITLVIRTGRIMAREFIVHALDLVEMVLVHAIQEHGGDVQLPADRDPSVYRTSDGATLSVESDLPNQRRLSYNILLAATQGLREFLIYRERYRAANFDIILDGYGRVGRGRLERPRQ